MALKDTVKKMKHHLHQIVEDLEKSENGNKAASQRVRTGTIALEKIAKVFRKESIKYEKTQKGKKKPARKAAPKAKRAVKPKAKVKAKPKAKTAVKPKAKAKVQKAKPKARKATAKAQGRALTVKRKKATAKLPARKRRK